MTALGSVSNKKVIEACAFLFVFYLVLQPASALCHTTKLDVAARLLKNCS